MPHQSCDAERGFGWGNARYRIVIALTPPSSFPSHLACPKPYLAPTWICGNKTGNRCRTTVLTGVPMGVP